MLLQNPIPCRIATILCVTSCNMLADLRGGTDIENSMSLPFEQWSKNRRATPRKRLQPALQGNKGHERRLGRRRSESVVYELDYEEPTLFYEEPENCGTGCNVEGDGGIEGDITMTESEIPAPESEPEAMPPEVSLQLDQAVETEQPDHEALINTEAREADGEKQPIPKEVEEKTPQASPRANSHSILASPLSLVSSLHSSDMIQRGRMSGQASQRSNERSPSHISGLGETNTNLINGSNSEASLEDQSPILSSLNEQLGW